jgi:hypothetical protein
MRRHDYIGKPANLSAREFRLFTESVDVAWRYDRDSLLNAAVRAAVECKVLVKVRTDRLVGDSLLSMAPPVPQMKVGSRSVNFYIGIVRHEKNDWHNITIAQFAESYLHFIRPKTFHRLGVMTFD